MEYTLVLASQSEHLVDKVNAKIREGWTPCGGPLTYSGEYSGFETTPSGKTIYFDCKLAQAMTRVLRSTSRR
jgi:hypothetical protein